MPSRLWCLSLLLPLLSACGSPSGGGRAACGLASLAGPTALLTQFSVPQQTLSVPPRNLPGRLVARFVAGGAFPAIVGRTDSTLVIGVEAPLAATARPGFGVLVVDQEERTRGVMLFEGDPVEGAPRLGDVSIGSTTIPLIGIQLDPAKIEDANCPLFPDSVLP
jgi:hypothetical protein